MTASALMGPSALPALDTQRTINSLLERMGWTVTAVEIDLVSETARVEIRGFDGRLLTLDARRGKATLTREQVTITTAVFGRRGDRAPVERVCTVFLGRHVAGDGLRSGMRAVARYLDDNSTGPRLGRAALAPLLATAKEQAR